MLTDLLESSKVFGLCPMGRLLQNRNIFLGCEIFKDFFLGVHDIYLYMCLMLFNLFIYLFDYWTGGGGVAWG